MTNMVYISGLCLTEQSHSLSCYFLNPFQSDLVPSYWAAAILKKEKSKEKKVVLIHAHVHRDFFGTKCCWECFSTPFWHWIFKTLCLMRAASSSGGKSIWLTTSPRHHTPKPISHTSYNWKGLNKAQQLLLIILQSQDWTTKYASNSTCQIVWS